MSALAVPTVAGTAAAAADAFRDAQGDMSQGADIHRVRVVNGDERLRIDVVHRDLVRSFRSGSSISVFLDTDRARKGPEYVFTGGTFSGADYALLEADGWKAAGSRQVPLRGGSYIMRVDYADDVARIGIDQVILGAPDAVRVEVKTGAELVTAPGPAPSTEVDWLGSPRRFTAELPRG